MLKLETYADHEEHLPSNGRFIIAQFTKETIIVYQAFKQSIAEYAVKNQKFGGDAYDFERTTWLKPSFLWMMYYSGWANKQDQENVLAIEISKTGFDEILRSAVMTKFDKQVYKSSDVWEKELNATDIQLQWESYHDLRGNKTDRMAVKIGLSGAMLQRFNNEWIQKIENITPYVKEQQQLAKQNKVDKIMLPRERAYAPADLRILTKINGTTISM